MTEIDKLKNRILEYAQPGYKDIFENLLSELCKLTIEKGRAIGERSEIEFPRFKDWT
jgi:hypothetical protein